MPRGVNKEHLPSKTCVVCQRPFTWRKKWERVWDDVTTCSKSCNRRRREARQRENQRERRHAGGGEHDDDDDDSGSLFSDTVNVCESKGKSADSANGGVERGTPIDTPRPQHHSERYDPGLDADALAHTLCEATALNSDEETSTTAASTPQRQHHHQDDDGNDSKDDAPSDARAARKAAKKAKKAARRARREGRGDPSVGRKPCHVCGGSVDLLIRCTIDVSGDWHMVCGRCWHTVSGGVVDGSPDHPHYRYGGLWKNRARR